ncbi:MAG: ABC transporter substrate-binding protein [Pseudomonadota bacterium]
MTLNGALKTTLSVLALSAVGVAAQAQTPLSLWYHGAGNPVERDVLIGLIDDFNTSQGDWVIELAEFPQASYNESVVAAGLAGNLPDIIDVDGPIMPNWAWAGYLQPLNLPQGTTDGFLPGTLGYWNGDLYTVGLWDAAVAVLARRSVLDEHGIRIPTLEEPWDLEEFDATLTTLQASGDFDYPFDVGMAWTGEWYPYAFGPFLQSFGGDILDVSVPTAEGVLNGDAGLDFGDWWQSLFDRDMVPGVSQDAADRETGFVDGNYAMQWNGNWAVLSALETFGDDLLILPAPDFGNGPTIGAASWQFGVSSTTEHADGANQFIEFMLQDEYLAAFSNALGLIPATASAAAISEYYSDGGPLEVFYGLSEAQARLRAVTPGYLVAALEFEKAMSDIASGADVADTLDAATDAINDDLERNNGYQ